MLNVELFVRAVPMPILWLKEDNTDIFKVQEIIIKNVVKAVGTTLDDPDEMMA